MQNYMSILERFWNKRIFQKTYFSQFQNYGLRQKHKRNAQFSEICNGKNMHFIVAISNIELIQIGN
jgi:hypothetical protein